MHELFDSSYSMSRQYANIFEIVCWRQVIVQSGVILEE